MYLLTSVNLKLRPRLLEELQPGTRLVSHAFDMGDWEPDVRETVDGRSVYKWVVPAKVGGRWAMKDGERSFTLDIDQQYQMLSGKATIGGKDVPIENGKLDGANIVFTLEVGGKPETFAGKVNGDKIEGGGASATGKSWTATKLG
jgi:hypothetical protein